MKKLTSLTAVFAAILLACVFSACDNPNNGNSGNNNQQQPVNAPYPSGTYEGSVTINGQSYLCALILEDPPAEEQCIIFSSKNYTYDGNYEKSGNRLTMAGASDSTLEYFISIAGTISSDGDTIDITWIQVRHNLNTEIEGTATGTLTRS